MTPRVKFPSTEEVNLARAELSRVRKRLDSGAIARVDAAAAAPDTESEEWATAPRYHIDPLYFFEPDRDPGMPMPRPAGAARAGTTQYIRDARNRITLQRQYADVPGEGHDTVFTFSPEVILGHVHYRDTPCKALSLFELQRFRGVPKRLIRAGERGSSVATYASVGGRILRFWKLIEESDGEEIIGAGALIHGSDGTVRVILDWSDDPGPFTAFDGPSPTYHTGLDPGALAEADSVR